MGVCLRPVDSGGTGPKLVGMIVHRVIAPLALSAVLLAGCGKKSGEVVTYGSKDSLDAKGAVDGHDHAGHGHGGGHAHKALMGGELVEVGEHQFNLEFKFDAARGVLQAWVLDAHAENFVRVAMPAFEVQEGDGPKRTIVLRAVGNEITGEKPGDTSAFEAEAAWLKDVKHFDGGVKALTVRGLEFRDIDFHFHP